LANKQSLRKSSLKSKPLRNENLANEYDSVCLNKSKSSTSKANGLEYKLHKKYYIRKPRQNFSSYLKKKKEKTIVVEQSGNFAA